MRDSKLDTRGSTSPTAGRPDGRAKSLGERLLVLRRIAHRNDRGIRGWPARVLRIRVSLAVVAVVAGALWIAGWLPWSDAFTARRLRSQCIDAFEAERWHDASAICAQAADRTGDSALGVRAARALRTLGCEGCKDEAVALAQRWFESSDDATARQIAGEIYDDREEPERAIALLEVALTGHLGRLDHVEAARDAGYLALAYMHAGRLGDAVEAAEAAVRESDLTSQDDANVRLRGRARMKLGKILVEIGDYSSARTMLWDAQQVLARWPSDQAWVFLQLGMLLQAEDNHASAASLFERALERALQAGVAPVVTAARLNLAYCWCELGRPDEAERLMAKVDDRTRSHPTAMLVAGMIAANRGAREHAEQLFARAAAGAPTDDYAMDIALRQGQLAERFSDLAAAERHYRTAIEFVEKLRKNTDSLGLRPLVLARRRAPYGSLLSLLARQGRRQDALVVAESLHARTWLDTLVGHAGPGAGASGGRAQAPSAAPLGRRLHVDAAGALSRAERLALLRGHEVVMFSETGSDLWRFHLVDGEVAGLDRLPEETRSLVERWRRDPDDAALAAQLGDRLIPPAARARSPRPLYIVANGALDTLPLAALRAGGRFLVEARAIARLPGIAALRCRAHATAQRPGVFLGDSRDDLASARQETLALAHALGGAAFVGHEATVERFEASRDAAVLHLAVHAAAESDGARLLFANAQQVTAADIVEHAIGPRVAVLAGCETAVGRNAEGWGALSSAFLAAGSRSVVGTLHAVVDTDAREIMERFYRHDGARRPAFALAEAQRELLATHPPSVWGAFVVHGSADAADCAASP